MDDAYGWIIDEYNNFKKLPPTAANIQPYLSLGTAILKMAVIDLYAAYQGDNTKRIESIHNLLKRNGICELMGMDIDYLDRLARQRDCRQYVYRRIDD